MGVSLQDVNQGLLNVSSIITKGMEAFDQVTGKTTVPTVAAKTVAPQPASPAQPASTQMSQSPPSSGLGAIPGWVWIAGIGFLIWRYG